MLPRLDGFVYEINENLNSLTIFYYDPQKLSEIPGNVERLISHEDGIKEKITTECCGGIENNPPYLKGHGMKSRS
jgi:hypothetical protein